MAKKRSNTVGSDTVHPYLCGYAKWKDLQFWEVRDDMTEKGKDYFRASLNKMAKAYNLTKVDQSLQ